MAPVEEEHRKSNTGLIIGIIGGVVALLAIVGFFVLGPGLGGKDSGDSADAKDGDGQPVAAVGGMTLELTPPDAVVKIDGKEYAGSSPRVISDLSVGKHTLEINGGDTFLPFTQEVTISAGQAMSLPLKLQVRDVTLEIKVDPPTAAVSLVAGTNTTAIGSGAELKHQLKRDAGVEYKLEGKADGYTDSSVPIVFTGDATQEVSVSLVKAGGAAVAPTPTPTPTPTEPKPSVSKPSKPKPAAKPKNAELKIGVAPGMPPADVWVDGKKESKKTPVFVKVSEGSHTVKWKWDDGKSDTQKVSVGANESKLLKGSK